MNFMDVLDKKADEIERPPLPPVGTYIMQVSKEPVRDTIANGDYDVVDFIMKIIAPTEDVDADEIQSFPGNLADKTMRHRFMFDTNDQAKFDSSLFNLKRFCIDHLKIDGGEDMSVKELLAASIGHRCLAQVTWAPDKRDPEVKHANIGRTAPEE